MNNLLFIALPYVSVVMFLIGMFYKYKTRVPNSELRDVRFFCFGLALVVLGHVAGFLCPSCVLAWNVQPMRLLVLEVGVFGLGLAILFSFLFFLARVREIQGPLILFCILLLILIVSGLWVANSYRWGTSWYAAVMTPYLRSLMRLSPDISAVQYMHWPIKVHIISAFLVIALFPIVRSREAVRPK